MAASSLAGKRLQILAISPSRPVFIYVKKSAATRPEVEAFTNFIWHQRANLVLQAGYVPLPNIAL